MMAAMLFDKRKVLAICGDGGFMMNSQELETAVRYNLNLVCIVLNDSSYGMIRWKQSHAGFADWGLEYKNPDFIKYAESYGATDTGYRQWITSLKSSKTPLRRAEFTSSIFQ